MSVCSNVKIEMLLMVSILNKVANLDRKQNSSYLSLKMKISGCFQVDRN